MLVRYGEKDEFVLTVIKALDTGEAQYDNKDTFIYNNKKYVSIKNTEMLLKFELIEFTNDMTIVYGHDGYHIIIRPTNNQTWYQWATDPNTEDLNINYVQEGLTLKALIISVNGQNNKVIEYSNGDGTGYSLGSNGTRCYSNQSIIPGGIYHLNYFMPGEPTG